jgi:hypothetical protein
MKTFFLSFPRLYISLTVPDKIADEIQTAFIHSILPRDLEPLHKYVVKAQLNGFECFKDGLLIGEYSSSLETVRRLEEDIENTLISVLGDWPAFHAGAVKVNGFASLIVGDPDTGKTTTTFNLVEMGMGFMCEEVSPVDPQTLLVHPYPQTLSLSRAYAEEYLSIHPIRQGDLKLFDSDIARYRPFRAIDEPVPLKTILLPAFHPSGSPGIELLSPGEVFTELLRYCFPPNTDDERLFDSVIRICEESDIFRVRTNNIPSLQNLLIELFGPD